jgi:hypothetical protein
VDDFGEPDAGLFEGGADPGEGPRGGKLGVGGAEVSDALRQLVGNYGFFFRHNNLINWFTSVANYNVSKTNDMPPVAV